MTSGTAYHEVIDFVRTPVVGCAFANYIANDPDREGIKPLVIPEALTNNELGTLLNTHLRAEPLAAAIVFPYVKTIDELVRLILQISQLGSWSVHLLRDEGVPEPRVVD